MKYASSLQIKGLYIVSNTTYVLLHIVIVECCLHTYMFVYQLHESCNYQHLDCVLQLYALMLWDNRRLYALSATTVKFVNEKHNTNT